MEPFSFGKVEKLRDDFRKLYSVPKATDLRKTKHEWVYFVQSTGPEGLIKIGRSFRIERRLRGLQAVSPVPLKLLGVFRAPRGTEFLLHECFSMFRVHGEWFVPVQSLIDLIKSVKPGSHVSADALRDMVRPFGIPLDAVAYFLLNGVRKRKASKARDWDDAKTAMAIAQSADQIKIPVLRYVPRYASKQEINRRILNAIGIL